jgi:hypothetical protein
VSIKFQGSAEFTSIIYFETTQDVVMKCWFCILLFIGCWTGDAAAAPAYGTRLPSQGQIFGGMQYHRIQERKLDQSGGRFESSQYFALLSYGIVDWVSLDLKGGMGDTDWRADGFDELRLPTWLTGGYGVRVKLFETESQKMKFVFGFQHISVHPKSRDIRSDPRGPRFKTVIDDWQFSLLGSSAVGDSVTVYGGGKWDRMDLITWTEGDRKRFKPKHQWGVVVGCDLDITRRMWLNMEANLGDGEAFSLGIHASF